MGHYNAAMRPDSNVPLKPPLSPRFWPAWCGLGVLYLLSRLPVSWRARLGVALGRIIRVGLRSRMRVAQTNMRLCFPGLDIQEREQLLAKHATSLGTMITELPSAWWTPGDKLRAICSVEGLHHLEEARAGDHGVLLLSVHFTTMDMAGRMLGLHVPRAAGHYRPHRNLAVEYAIHRARSRDLDRLIPRRAIREAIQWLRDGGVMWYAPDQDYKAVDTEFVSFFGQQASTITSTQKLARAGRAAVVPFWLDRLANGKGYTMHFGPAISDFPRGDRLADTQTVSDTVETIVRRAPEHYLWIHQRFKTRPPGEASVY